jgi:hypothetical protein
MFLSVNGQEVLIMKKLGIALLVLFTVGAGVVAAQEVQSLSIPVAGAYMEPALDGPVAYMGVVTIYWKATNGQPGTPAFTHTTVFEADAWRLADSVKFRMFGACGGLCEISGAGTATMNASFWATGVAGRAVPTFEGKLSLVAQVPSDGNPPEVTLFALAAK